MCAQIKKTPETLRSYRWYGAPVFRSLGHRARMAQQGYAREDYMGKPVIAIVNTWSEINPCHTHFKERAEQVKRGILQAGGFPIELPAMSLGEPYVRPAAMLYRNLLAIETEELLRSHPIDGAVLMGGCDKTTPGLIMGAISMNIPAIYLPAGPSLRGDNKGKFLGSGTDLFASWYKYKAGEYSEEQLEEVENGISRSAGTCMTMGTAPTMMSIADALGFCFTGASSIVAPDSRHAIMAERTGRRIVEMVWEDLKPSDFLCPASFDNAITTALALGGSTNAVIHVIAMARRAGIPLTVDRFDELSQKVPHLANIRPAGKYLMEDFYYAGGLRALLNRLGTLIDGSPMTVNGKTLGENFADAEVYNDDVILPLDKPLGELGSLVILRGNLAPNSAVLKIHAADPRLHDHVGRAVVFNNVEDLQKRIDDPALDVDENSVLVLKNAGPLGAPGFPEWGQIPIPKKLLERGIRDMVRLSDARMSGTSFGSCVVHIAPESFIGGPLALVRDGDNIELSVSKRQLNLLIPEEEMEQRREAWTPPQPYYPRGYGRLFAEHVSQADDGCDFDFLQTVPGEQGLIPEPPIQ
ncbi:dihydroxy-acid dehydratase [Brenneria goodwinii]|uniref:Dihydroxy-acid dehydratase n=1 Tax=Brenneria goodwinii TaxID=1109412 RepID=A0AAE8EMC6_9GAMM|nr:L-arabinonate dehydratase [Brenneria goodwinii]ATA23690.1 dihydroxy-acid dehydratase [Brenneria goodwinii]MCG8154664.1 dihydroxy-acid dehydratase [Brenneria goodwinii]MCG8160000.1 dihydroxy-acid dehydratase [Brenneria goodwinii]MCG8163902.1 dihydroxy-acid dehydratase [Brenneria goodwinii]MCG8168511.1 dihydroxy-acid dehydratase [Brenneria goodwinii]